MDTRQQKGFQIATEEQVTVVHGGWIVNSQSKTGSYKVSTDFVCNCPDSEINANTCKHAYAVRYYLNRELETPKGIEIDKYRLTYKQAWSTYNKAQAQEVKLFDELLMDLCMEIDEPPELTRAGRKQYNIRDGVFCAVQKVYSHLSSRRAASLFGFAEQRGQIKDAPHFNRSSVVLNNTKTTEILQKLITITASPLKAIETDFAIDSSGFRTQNFDRYCEYAHGIKRQHKWLKAHICTGVKTNIVTAVVIGEEHSADSLQFIPLAQKTHKDGFNIQEMSADKAYSSKDNLGYIDQIGGTPYIPFKISSRSRRGQSHIWRKMFHYFQLNQEEFMEHYHKRSNVETTFSAIKKKFGENLKSKNTISQTNELLAKILCYNITVLIAEMFELGIKPDFHNQNIQKGE